MNVQDAIYAHAQWKLKLSAYLKTPNGSINANTLGADNQCELGKWLHGEAVRYANLPEFAAVCTAHTEFHRAAADIVKKADKGMPTDGLLDMQSAYGMASMSVVKALKILEQKIS